MRTTKNKTMKKNKKNHSGIILNMPEKVFKIKTKQRKTIGIASGCLYVSFAGFVYYFDNSTNEAIIEKWKDK